MGTHLHVWQIIMIMSLACFSWPCPAQGSSSVYLHSHLAQIRAQGLDTAPPYITASSGILFNSWQAFSYPSFLVRVCVCVCAYTCIHVCISLRCEYLMRSGLADLYVWNVLLILSVSRVSSCACSFASLELNNFLFPAWIPRRHRPSLLPGLVSETVYNRASIVLWLVTCFS